MCTCVGNIEATYSKQAKKNIKIKMQREILLVKSASKNYKCSSRLHILQQQQKYVHTKILFSVLYTESQNKLFFSAAVAASLFVHGKNFTPENEFCIFCILDLPALLLKVKTDFPLTKLPKMKMKMKICVLFLCSLCQNVCFCAYFACVFCCWKNLFIQRRMREREI